MGEHEPVIVQDLGEMAYEPAYGEQRRHVEEVLAARGAEGLGEDPGPGRGGRILLVEHRPPVITVSRRPTAMGNLVAAPEMLERLGVTVATTDRGGDITYHGPGQLVVYPILDLNYFRLGLHDYMRLLEGAVIETCGAFGVSAHRDACATGVWVGGEGGEGACRRGSGGGVGGVGGGGGGGAKICAMGVRVKRWVSMHGLALNITTNLEHFGLIVPCGLMRPVTSLERELGDRCPAMGDVKRVLSGVLVAKLMEAREGAERARGGVTGGRGLGARP